MCSAPDDMERMGSTGCLISFITLGTITVSLGAHAVWLMRVCAAAFGTPHRRRRFYLVASLHSDARDVLLSQASLLFLAGRVPPTAPWACDQTSCDMACSAVVPSPRLHIWQSASQHFGCKWQAMQSGYSKVV